MRHETWKVRLLRPQPDLLGSRQRPLRRAKIGIVASLIVLGCLAHAAEPAENRDRPFPPDMAPRQMTVPPGFRVTLFAGEPDVVQPIAFAFDDRGRLWVAECYSYPKWQTDGKPGKDRILIFEDKDGDGRFDDRKVFHDSLANLSGLQVGFGGVWVCATPNLLFIPDRNGDDRPDSAPVVVLDGWDLKAKHNVFNSLTWGPDGWLYGCNGILSNSRVGKPGTPDSGRVEINCGVWRYHPTKGNFEVFATGTTNPWGLDFDDLGQLFITNCVIDHVWHVMPGSHFQRMFGQDFNPHWYVLMRSCADHIHWAGGPWQDSRGGRGEHDAPGGGHAHAGAMIYLGDNWPDSYRNSVFMCNIHGNRINHDFLVRQGSGYVARHGRDFLLANDPWFRGLAIQSGPDGGVYVSDWTDTGECHNYIVADQRNGRIFKITFGQPVPPRLPLSNLSDLELARHQLQKNEWYVRHSRRLLQERAAAGRIDPNAVEQLLTILRTHPDPNRKLRAVWALHAIGRLNETLRLELLANPHEAIRAWAVRLALDDQTVSTDESTRLAQLAVADESGFVRLHLAAGLQRLPLSRRRAVAAGLIRRELGPGELNQSLLIWYGIEPLVDHDAKQAARLIAQSAIPLLRELLARRLCQTGLEGLEELTRLLESLPGESARLDMLRGMLAGLEGRRLVAMPASWPKAFASLRNTGRREIVSRARLLALNFGDVQVQAELQRLAVDGSASPADRVEAIQALTFKRDPSLLPMLHRLLGEKPMRSAVIRALAAFEAPQTPERILKYYALLDDTERTDAIQTLLSRPAYARALLDAIGDGRVARKDLSALAVRQVLALNQPALTTKLRDVWGTIRPASQEKAVLMPRYQKLLHTEALTRADRSRGRLLYSRTCGACHRLFGEGGEVGPELTGSQRTVADYFLENVLDPSAIVPRDYKVTIVETQDGRVVTGIVKHETAQALTIQTPNDRVIVPLAEVESRRLSEMSMMPEGLLTGLTDDEVRDLFAYLSGPAQVPLPK